jgi:hypothetical protein
MHGIFFDVWKSGRVRQTLPAARAWDSPPVSSVSSVFQRLLPLLMTSRHSFACQSLAMASRRPNPQAIIEARRKEEEHRNSIQRGIDASNKARGFADWCVVAPQFRFVQKRTCQLPPPTLS